MRNLTPDLMRRDRIPASGPTLYFEKITYYDIAVGTAKVQISRQSQPATTIFIQADLNNNGVISVRDTEVAALGAGAKGIQINAGQVLVFSPTTNYRNLMGGPFMGPSTFMGDTPIAAAPHLPELVIDLADFWLIASLAGQIVHVAVSHYTKVPGQ